MSREELVESAGNRGIPLWAVRQSVEIDRGQRNLVNSDLFPTNVRPEDKQVLEEWGTHFGPEVEGSAIFCYAKLPTGWAKRPGRFSVYVDIVDEKGRRRGVIYYHADHKEAHLMELTRRFTVDHNSGGEEEPVVGLVRDQEKVVHTTPSIPSTGDLVENLFRLVPKAEAQATAWLNQHYPNWGDPRAYWD